jgi:predicted transcriptional regulator of viral defense system
MAFLSRRYYVALLSAAELHGAAHQAPQVFHVMVDRHVRDRDVGRARLRFFAGAHVELTGVDLVEHPGPGGGIDNVATVLTELGPLDGAQLATAQRARAGWAGC